MFMSQESTAPNQPEESGAASSVEEFAPSEDMKKRNRQLGLIFLGIVAFLILLTVVTRIILSS
ncbi:hypothetical protein DN745_12720 [Bradymonas sediminis]|uniref:Uncharacterized protein n=2 Tax=Bradymonas sediminis TaxID=1548548 RepID=A0A2Z4FMF0_9DELT|nr:hypothetical protein DN745_12720 [Bradymonas sediminis]